MNVEKTWQETEQLLDSELSFPEKVKQSIFNNKESASQINPEFYTHIMKEYTTSLSYIEDFYTKRALPRMMELFSEGKEQGYVDPSISNQAIMVYIQIFREAMMKEEVYQSILPLTEDITKLLFYGLVGKSTE